MMMALTMKNKHFTGQAISRELVELMAQMFGEYSAAAQALKNAAEREQKGQKVEFFRAKGSIVVAEIK